MIRPTALILAALACCARAAAAADMPASDEFDDPKTLSEWRRIHQTEGWNADQLQVWDVDKSQPGRMVMKPHTVTWYQDYRGPLVYKAVEGNVALTTRVEVRNGRNQPQRPQSDYSLAGVMLRRPRAITNASKEWTPGGEDYVFLSLGFGNAATGTAPHLEVKTTDDSVSNLELTPAPGLTATLQLARVTNRVGTFVVALRQEPGGAWRVHRRYRRDDLAGELQAGLVTYTDYSRASVVDARTHNGTVLKPGNPLLGNTAPRPDLVAGFDYARYAGVTVPAGLENADLADAGAATDAQLLDFLGAGAAKSEKPVPGE